MEKPTYNLFAEPRSLEAMVNRPTSWGVEVWIDGVLVARPFWTQRKGKYHLQDKVFELLTDLISGIIFADLNVPKAMMSVEDFEYKDQQYQCHVIYKSDDVMVKKAHVIIKYGETERTIRSLLNHHGK
jgi:hypothetical protein